MCGIAGFVNLAGEHADGARAARRWWRRSTTAGRTRRASRRWGPRPSATPASASSTCRAAPSRCAPTTGLWITFNGEIYNYVELREELDRTRPPVPDAARTPRSSCTPTASTGPTASPASTASSRSRSGTSGRAHALPVARPAGQEAALLRASVGRQFVFGSEMKAILAHPAVPRALDLSGLDQILTFWCTVPPRTIFEAIRELPPGHSLLLQDGKARIWAYWQLDYTPDERRRSEADYAEELRALLVDAVAAPHAALGRAGRRLRERRPRLDGDRRASSASYTDVPLDTFSVTFEDPEYDESAFQRQVVRPSGHPRAPLGALPRRGHRRACSPTSSGTPSSRSCAPRRRRCFLLSRLVRANGLQGRADRRGLGRGARRLRHLQGSEGPALLGAQPDSRLAAAAAEAPLSVHDQPAEPAAGVPARVLPRPAGGPRRARSSRTCRAGS